jgi:bifunctional DNase/RNase
MKKIKLDIVGLSYSQTQSGAYALVLGEVNGKRRLPIIIGSFEAQAIAIEIEKMSPSRPLTHDLFKTLTLSYQIEVEEVLIYNLVDGIFFAKIICNNGTKTVELDSRTSDAIALAVRYHCPIYTYDFILAAAGILIEGSDYDFLENIDQIEDLENKSKEGNIYQGKSDIELQTQLQKALQEEDYEKAAHIRDELTKRGSN